MCQNYNFNCYGYCINPLNAKFTKWPNTLKQFVGKLPTNCLSVFGHFVGLALKELTKKINTIATKKTNTIATNVTSTASIN